MLVSSRAPVALVLVAPHILTDPQYVHLSETGRIIRCGLRTRLYMGPYSVPTGCELSGQASGSGSLTTEMTDRPGA